MTERRGKYNAHPVEIDGHRFDSEAEARRYGELKLLERAGEICLLEVHPTWDLVVNGQKVGLYEADFVFYERGAMVVEDVKSPPTRTREYKLKKRLMLALHGIEVKET